MDEGPVNESEPSVPDDESRAAGRRQRFDALARSARFSDTELRTIRAIAFEHLTVAQLARLDGCSRQAVPARVWGNSRYQGGLVKKAAKYWHETEAIEDINEPPTSDPLVLKWLRAPVVDGTTRLHSLKGIPQGAPVSPVIANMYLTGFDRMLEASGRQHVRYADDFIVLVDAPDDAPATLAIHRGVPSRPPATVTEVPEDATRPDS